MIIIDNLSIFLSVHIFNFISFFVDICSSNLYHFNKFNSKK
jgi:hypothetical protein